MPKGFRTKSATSTPPPDPESLFRNLRRSSQVPYLWSHQSDLLRSYEQLHRDTADVALELPTGSGKTLVGLLIGEWRRQAFEERVIYLAPTRQLCYQVSELAKDYGIQTRVLVGRQDEYPADQYGDFATARSIAVTSYSGVFNSNPRLNDAHVLVLDDAHAAEGYVSSLWTVSLRRSDVPDLFNNVLDLLGVAIPRYVLAMMKGTLFERSLISAIPFPSAWKFLQPLRDLLNGMLESGALPEGIRFPWLMIRQHLDVCQIYYSWSEIALRPIIPPTWTHSPFSGTKQRIYMSATLGEGGDLERIFGISHINRLPIPKGWERQGSGRRLMLFPDRSLDDVETGRFVTKAIERQGRALVICASHVSADQFANFLEEELPNHRILRALEIEKSLEPFVTEDKAILLLAGRYDGLDLRDEACRLLIVHGLPAGVNLQERFLYERIGATALLRDRVRTRLTQAMGRCTRNSTDYATVLLEGDRLFDFCTKSETRQGLHPEIQAELAFGLENSADHESADDFMELVNLFLTRGKEWEDAEQEIVRRRESAEKKTAPITDTLAAIVPNEVEYVRGLWSGNFEYAQEAGRKAADRLDGLELSSYRSWWYYLAGIPAYLLFAEKGRKDQETVARDLWSRARAASVQPWFRELDAFAGTLRPGEGDQVPRIAAQACEAVASRLIEMGLLGSRFDKAATEMEDHLASTESTEFELGLLGMGRMLGWDATRPKESGAPDGVWQIVDKLVLLFEAKTDEDPKSGVSKSTLLQAGGHYKWTKAKLTLSGDTRVAVIVVTPRKFLDSTAVPHAADVYLISPDEVRSGAAQMLSVLRNIRGQSSEKEQLALQWTVYEAFRQQKLLPQDIFRKMTSRKMAELPHK